MTYDKLIINLTPTGMVPTKADTPHVPVTPEEIAADCYRCYNAGASIVHIHARGPDGTPTYRVEVFREIVSRVRAQCPELIICVTTSGRTFKTFEERSQSLDLEGDLKPDMASLTLGSMNFPKQVSVNGPEMIRALAEKMRERKIVPEMEVFDLGMIDYAKYLMDHGLLREPFYFNLLLGSLGTLGATPLHLATMVNELPPKAIWAGAGIGRYQLYMNAMAISMGGHVRVGLEDNIYFDTGREQLATNLKLVERLVGIARAVGREVASPAEARKMIGLKPRCDPQA